MKVNKYFSMLFISLSLIISTPLYASSLWTPMSDIVNSGILNTQITGKDSFSDVEATVDNGIAIFTGRVSSKAQVQQLMRIAHSISGVRGVDVSGLRIGK